MLDGLAATRQIVGDPELASVKVLILTTFEIDEYVFEALRSGASGFLGKGAEADELLAASAPSAGDALYPPPRPDADQPVSGLAGARADAVGGGVRGLSALTERDGRSPPWRRPG